jgi:hypothetical protein
VVGEAMTVEEIVTATQEFHAEHGWIPFASCTPRKIGQKLAFDNGVLVNHVWQVVLEFSSLAEFMEAASAVLPGYQFEDLARDGYLFFYRITALD